jgi:hypothetical protein
MCPDFPTIGGASASDIWNYATRVLTHITGTPRSDLIGADESLDTHGYTSVRAGLIDNLDVAVSTRSSHSAGDVWAVAARTLTHITGDPRTDLLGEDATFEAGTGARKAVLDKLLAPLAPTEGTVTTDGTVQTLVEKTGTLEFQLDGYVDLTHMAAGDAITIIQSMKIASGGAYVAYASENYSDAQTLKLLHIVTKPAVYGLKVTITETGGAHRAYDFEFFQRKRTA